METIRGQEQDLRKVVSQARHEAGLNALLELAKFDRDRALVQWQRAVGADLVKYQSEYNSMQRIMDYILKAPREFATQKD